MPFPNVPLTSNGQQAAESAFNAPLQALVQRTDHLLSLINGLAPGASIRYTSMVIAPGTLPGMPVYFDTATGVFRPALAALDASAGLNAAAASAQWRGVATNVVGLTATVIAGGQIALPTATWADVIDTGLFAAGIYYLSSLGAGTITRDPGSLGIQIGTLDSTGVMFLAGASPTNLINHVHHKVRLVGDPAGTPNTPSIGDPQTVAVPDSAVRGWLPADAGNFPGFTVGEEIPTGAFFGYNIQQSDEVFLRSVFPPIPLETSELSFRGDILDGTTAVVNRYGIWWMTDAYGEVPWSPTWATPGDSDPVFFWTTRIPSDNSLFATLYAQVLQELFDNFGAIGVRSLSQGAGITVTDTGGGNFVVTNTGVRSSFGGLGVRTVSLDGLGTDLLGLRGRTRSELNLEFQIPRAPVPAPDVVLLQTTYPGPGTPLVLYGDRINLVGEYVDYQLFLGDHLPDGVAYTPTIRVVAAVDSAAAVEAGNFLIRAYVVPIGDELNIDTLEQTFTRQLNIGQPNVLQTVTASNVALTVTRRALFVVRVEQASGANALPVDTLRVVSVHTSFARV